VDQAESVVVGFSVPTDFAELCPKPQVDDGAPRTGFRVRSGGGAKLEHSPQGNGVPDGKTTLIVIEIHVNGRQF